MSSTIWLLLGACFCSALFASFTLLEAICVRKRLHVLNKTLEPNYREDGRVRPGIWQRLSSRLNRTEYGKSLDQAMHRVNLKLTPLQWVVISIGCWLGLGLIIWKLLRLDFVYSGLLAYLVFKLGSAQWLKSRHSKLTQAINRQLPEVCRLLSSSTKAGLSIQQGMEMVATEMKPPAGRTFQTIVSELKVGTEMDAVLTRMNERIKSKDLKLLINAIAVQRRAGGNLAQVLSHLAKTLEERQRINKELHNSSSEPRFIALVLTCMPIVIILLFNLALEGFVMLLFTMPGMVLIAISAVLIGTGLVIIRKIANVKV
ncbi:type II secretion system F family protein [Brevibacillus humidisoli]|uniref:type II secretion system F family protein n=1 Tax=Brevibacillus humidisoli TaxID=2895522 RepID=UPI001E333517|nr:type II secretion system F family protein [Brevibacillus humidisoli]UFJ40797.1 type II secretion system F family protein [Brevibacillus humidisoli]